MSDYSFYQTLRDTLNNGKSNSVVLWGNIYDLFFHEDGYTSLVDYVLRKTKVSGILQLVYELNGPIRMSPHIRDRIKQIWDASYIGKGCRETFEEKLLASVGRPAVALELLRQITMACRGKAKNKEKLLIIIEAADMMIPAGSNFSSLNASDRRCVCIAKDWFSDPNFVMGRDSVILLSESVSEIHPNVARLPQMAQIEVPSPSLLQRGDYIDSVFRQGDDELSIVTEKVRPCTRATSLAQKTAGLTLQAVRQILCDKSTNDDEIFAQVERFIKSQVGEDTIEFKKPDHLLEDVMGNTRLKTFIADELIPRFRSTGPDALSGAAVGGPIGCHRKGEKVLTNFGHSIKVEDVKVGQSLLGMNGIRTVVNTCRGKQEMYEVTPVKGKCFYVNEQHVLTLVKTQQKHNGKPSEKGGEIVDVMLKDWLKWSKWRKSIYKLFRSEGVEFDSVWELIVDPYFVGVLLGDGSVCHTPKVTTVDKEIVEEVHYQASKYSLKVVPYKISYSLVGTKKSPNPLSEDLKEIGLWGKIHENKFIPHQYKVASKEDRLELLAGLIDTDGSLGGDFSSKSKKLAEDVAFVARSLGMAAYIKPKGDSYRVSISGNLHLIPCRIPRKVNSVRKQKKSVLRTGFSVKKVGVENYYGFRLDGDGRYLLDDFTVTHNSGKSFIFEAVAAEIGCPVIVLKNLRSQYFGQTDVVFERLRRVLESIGKVLIFVDEADTQFGRVSGDVHATEKRLTGKIQAMMSDPKLKGQVVWLLMTARIHLLSPDIRRPGRVGDLIIPVLDPEGDDRLDFARWCLSGIPLEPTDDEEHTGFQDRWAQQMVGWGSTQGYSAAAWAGLKSSIVAKGATSLDAIKNIVWDMIQPDIAEEREYQTTQALLNCTRKTLLPASLGTVVDNVPGYGNISFSMTDLQKQWKKKIAKLEAKGYG